LTYFPFEGAKLMLDISRKIEYAMMVLKTMCDGDLTISTTARELSQSLKTPFDTTSKVMQSMNNAGILKSIQGVKGGYVLNCDLSTISYSRFAEIIEGEKFMYRCAAKQDICDYVHFCNISRFVRNINRMSIEFFDRVNMEEILETSTKQYFLEHPIQED